MTCREGVDFAFDHVVGMADLHGYAFRLDLKRTDMPPANDGTTRDGALAFALTALDTVPLGSPLEAEVARLKVERANPCPTPAAGLRARAPVRLARAATYDLAAAFQTKAAPHWTDQLSGVAFGTSRYRSPQELVDDLLGLSAGGAGGVDGDIEILGAPVMPPLTATDQVSDAGLDMVLERWMRSPWPGLGQRTVAVVQQGALDRLVRGAFPAGATLVRRCRRRPAPARCGRPARRAGAFWRCSSSPRTDRASRTATDPALRLGAGAFGLRVSNRARTRMLFCAAAPIRPVPGDRLTLTMTDASTKAAVSASAPFALTPAFAEEVS